MTHDERMHRTYTKQCWVTLGTVMIVALMTHIFPMYFLFPGLNEMRIWGFPADYWLTMVVSWFCILPVLWLYIEVSEKIDKDIEEISSTAEDHYPGGQS